MSRADRLKQALVLLCLWLPACSGGGGGNGGGGTPPVSTPTTPPPNVTPSPMPTVTPTPSPSPTIAPAVYSGTLTQTTNVLDTAQQNPQAQPTYTVTSTVAESAKTFPNESFAATPAAEIASVEIDTSPNSTYTINTGSYYVTQTVGSSTDVLELGYTTKDSNGVSRTVQYGSGNGLVDVLPETTGSFGPNNAALTENQTNTDNTTIGRTVNAGGDYSEQDVFDGGDSNTLLEEPNLTGSIASTGEGLQVSFAAPQAATGGEIIPFTFTVLGQSGSGSLADWYPGSALSSETDVDNGPTTIPAACNVPAAIARSATLLVQTIDSFDLVNGTTENQQISRYVEPTYGVVCMQSSDTYDAYYDYSGQFGNNTNPDVQSTPIYTVVTTETLGEQSGPTPTEARHRSFVRLEPMLGGFHTLVARVRADHTRRLLAALTSRKLGSHK